MKPTEQRYTAVNGRPVPMGLCKHARVLTARPEQKWKLIRRGA